MKKKVLVKLSENHPVFLLSGIEADNYQPTNQTDQSEAESGYLFVMWLHDYGYRGTADRSLVTHTSIRMPVHGERSAHLISGKPASRLQ